MIFFMPKFLPMSDCFRGRTVNLSYGKKIIWRPLGDLQKTRIFVLNYNNSK